VTNRQSERRDAQPIDRLLGLADLVTPMAVRVAATLRVVDHLRAGTTDPAALAEATGTDADALLRLLRHLAAVGVLAETAPGRFAPTEVGDLLADGHPAMQRSWLDLSQAVSRADLAFLRLLDAVRTGRPVYEDLHGRPFWADLSADPTLGASFDALMATEEEAAFAVPVAAYDWRGVRHVLDVGGGTGGLLKAVARAEPGVRGTLLELPGPAARARERTAEAGLADRIEVVEGDFLDELPVTADVVVLSFVLLNWPDDDARRILKRCADALEPGGRILLYERADVPVGAAKQASDLFFSVLDMRMLVFLGGRVRTTEEWSALVASAGLTVVSAAAPLRSPTVPFESALLVLARDADNPSLEA
jgi:SAM-dependent methyltransferase